jgi:hypothetical protein
MLDKLQESPDNAYDHCKQNTEEDHGCDGKIKAEILFFYTDITGQVTYPIEFIVKKINYPANYHHSAADEHNILAGIGIHKKIILIGTQCFCR